MSDIDDVVLSVEGKIAIITLNVPRKLNALNQDLYFKLSQILRQVAKMDDVYVTVLTGKGKFFSAGADFSSPRPAEETITDARRHYMQNFLAYNFNTTNSFYTHPKILVTALNGPVVGLSASLIALSDFIYCTPDTYLLTPFSSLGLVAEGGASRSFVQRLGISKANEALIMSKRITAEELLSTGFVNKIFESNESGQGSFLERVIEEIKERLGDHLNSDSLLKVKELIRKPERDVLESQNAAEVLTGLERWVEGVPQEEFRRLASGEKRHKM